MEDYVKQLEDRIKELERIVGGLTNAAQIDPLVAKTIALKSVAVASSAKTAASATRAVNEAGAATYSVMYPPTGFISVGGFNVPYIT